MKQLTRITFNPNVMGGKPCIRGLRVTVGMIVGLIYAYEQRSPELVEPYSGKFRRNKAAWNFFQAQAPSYRKIMNWWVVSAKKEETRLRRLEQLIEESAQGRRMRTM